MLLVLAGLAFVAAMAGCAVANMTVSAIVADVNRGRPRAERIAALGWYPGKLERVLAAYRVTYPDAPRVRRLWQAIALMAAGLLACAALAYAAGRAAKHPVGQAVAPAPPNEALQLSGPRGRGSAPARIVVSGLQLAPRARS